MRYKLKQDDRTCLRLVLTCISSFKILIFGLCFILYFLKLSAGYGFWKFLIWEVIMTSKWLLTTVTWETFHMIQFSSDTNVLKRRELEVLCQIPKTPTWFNWNHIYTNGRRHELKHRTLAKEAGGIPLYLYSSQQIPDYSP